MGMMLRYRHKAVESAQNDEIKADETKAEEVIVKEEKPVKTANKRTTKTTTKKAVKKK